MSPILSCKRQTHAVVKAALWVPYTVELNVGLREICARTRAGPASGALCGAPSHDKCEGCAETGATPTCGRCLWTPTRWSYLWNQDTCEECAETGVKPACGRCIWILR
eukprot:381635-Pyramimonas_sp.AAC.1